MDPKKRDPLLAAVCHDLRAPLAAVTMGANFVLQTTERDAANARSVKILEAMLRSCTQMERLIRNFGDLSAIDADAVELRRGAHDVGAMLERAADDAKERAAAKSVKVEVTKPAAPIALACDHDRLVRALGHLLDNAIEATPGGSSVALSAVTRGDSFAFTVVDRGEGPSEDVRAHLFDRPWLTQRAGRVGAAFGLAIARGFARAHGGDLSLSSAPGEPTTFTLEIAAASDAQ